MIEGRWGQAKIPPPSRFFPLTSSNSRISPKNYKNSDLKALPRVNPKVLNLNKEHRLKKSFL